MKLIILYNSAYWEYWAFLFLAYLNRLPLVCFLVGFPVDNFGSAPTQFCPKCGKNHPTDIEPSRPQAPALGPSLWYRDNPGIPSRQISRQKCVLAMLALWWCQSNKERSSNQTKAGASPSDPYANDYVIETMLVAFFLTFEDQGLTTTSAWQPPMSGVYVYRYWSNWSCWPWPK